MCLIVSLRGHLDNPVTGTFINPTPKACLAHMINILGDDGLNIMQGIVPLTDISNFTQLNCIKCLLRSSFSTQAEVDFLVWLIGLT